MTDSGLYRTDAYRALCLCIWLDPLVWLGFIRKLPRQKDLFETVNYALSQDGFANLRSEAAMTQDVIEY